MSHKSDALARLRDLAESALHTPVEIATGQLGHATGTVVKMRGSNVDLIAKLHRSPSLHEREVHAYRAWTPHLGAATPELIAVAPELPGIVITAVPGTPLDTHSPSPDDERDAHRDAGRILARLHALPTQAAASDITDYLADRGEHWLARLGHHITQHDAHLVREHLRLLRSTTHTRVAPCHLDFQPRNLLWHTDRRTRVIDFENSREDLAARDLARLATRIWPQRPDLREAFLDGYGPLEASDTAVLHHVTALEAVTSMAHGLQHGDDYLLDLGRRLLANLAH